MWYVVAAYDGERSFYNKCNWPFLGDVLARLYRYFVKIAIVTMQFIEKKNNMGCSCQTNNKHVFGVGKGKWRRRFQVWIKNQPMYNPTNKCLPTNLRTPQTFTFQFFKPHKQTYQPLNLYPKPHKPMWNLNCNISAINKNILCTKFFSFWNVEKFNKQSVRFKTVYYCTSLNATRHHRCGNETKSDVNSGNPRQSL